MGIDIQVELWNRYESQIHNQLLLATWKDVLALHQILLQGNVEIITRSLFRRQFLEITFFGPPVTRLQDRLEKRLRSLRFNHAAVGKRIEDLVLEFRFLAQPLDGSGEGRKFLRRWNIITELTHQRAVVAVGFETIIWPF